jgi:hypothetical protein
VAEPPPSQMGMVSAPPILALGGGRTTPMGPASIGVAAKWGWFRPPPKIALGVAEQPKFYIYIKEIIKIIITKHDSHVSVEVYYRDMCRTCTPTPVG